MTKSAAEQASKTQVLSAAPGAAQYANFQFLRLEARFHSLLPNEKVVAKQEFLSACDTFQRQLGVASYALTGLRADCDILLWRVSRSLEALSEMTSRLQYSGMGKFLAPAYSFLGTVEGPELGAGFGSGKYLFVHPCRPSSAPGGPTRAEELMGIVQLRQQAESAALRLHVADCVGLDAAGFVLAFETDTPEEYRRFVRSMVEDSETKLAAATLGGASFTCLQRAIPDIVDAL